MLTLELPYPPSINHYFRNFRGRTVISAAGRTFRKEICRRLHEAGVQPMSGRLAVCVDIFPPDHRRRDVDNVQKAQVVSGGKSLVEIRPVGVAFPGRAGCALCGRYWN